MLFQYLIVLGIIDNIWSKFHQFAAVNLEFKIFNPVFVLPKMDPLC